MPETSIKDYNPHVQGLIYDSIENAVSMVNDMNLEKRASERGELVTQEVIAEQTLTFLAIALDPAQADPAVVPETLKKIANDLIREHVYPVMKFDRPE